MILRLSLDLPEDATYVRTTRLLSRALLQDLQVVPVIVDDVETIVTELYSNVVRHAQSKATRVVMTLEYFQSEVVIVVKDEGLGFTPESVPVAGTTRSDSGGGERVGGFGMVLLNGLSDKIDFMTTDPHGTTVRVVKNLLFETQDAADQACARDIGNGGTVTLSCA